jgi:hypothetical protein
MIAMTVEQFRQSTSQQNFVPAPPGGCPSASSSWRDDLAHLVPYHRTKRKLRGHCRVRAKFPSRTFVSLTSFSGNGGSKFRKRVLKFTGIFASTGLRTQIGFSTASGLAHPSANYRGSHWRENSVEAFWQLVLPE